MMITRKSPLTGNKHTMEIDVTKTAMYAWKCGELIQIAMPHLLSEEREFIQTGYTPADWKKMFGGNKERCQCDEHENTDADGFLGTRL